MKHKISDAKFSLNKMTITRLNDLEMKDVWGRSPSCFNCFRPGFSQDEHNCVTKCVNTRVKTCTFMG